MRPVVQISLDLTDLKEAIATADLARRAGILPALGKCRQVAGAT